MRLGRAGRAVTLEVDRATLAPGDPVRVAVALGRGEDKARELRVALEYVNRFTHEVSGEVGAASTGRKKQVVTVASATLAPGSATTEVVLRLPDDAPPTAEGSVAWRVLATADLPRARDLHRDAELVVRSSPAGHRDRLTAPVEQADGFTAEIEVDRRDLRPGDVVRGSVIVVAPGGLDGPGLYARVRGVLSGRDGTTSSYAGDGIALVEPARLVAGAPQRHDLEVRVPEDARPTFVAEHSSLDWYVEVGIPRKLVADRLARLPVVVRRLA